MQKLIGDAERAGDWTGAAAWAQRWAEALPFEEAAHLRLIESLRMNGRNSDALGVHAAFVTRARAALDLEPSAEFMRLGGGAREELARGRSAERSAPPLLGSRINRRSTRSVKACVKRHRTNGLRTLLRAK